jgi:endoglucanase
MPHHSRFSPPRAVACGAILLSVLHAGCLLPPSRMSAAGAGAGEDDPRSPHNLLANGTFDGGVSLPWTSSFTAPGDGDSSVVDGALCLDIRNGGANRWDAQIRHRDMTIQRGHRYRVAFRAWADKPTNVRPKVGMAGPPYAEYWADSIELGPTPRFFAAEFEMTGKTDPTAEFAFHAGAEMLASGVPVQICIDDVLIEDPEFTRGPSEETLPIADLVVNQVGYAPGLEKLALLRNPDVSAQRWELLDAQGRVVASGETVVHGSDPASGEHVHVIDFSSFTTPGGGYRLRAGSAQSHPFVIREDVYAKLKYDALAFFYHQRSGVEIKLPHAGEARWVRPAGHTSDSRVPCAPDAGCNYALDVSGGWYDAGDHGKYVVNGGISAWTLLALYERSAGLKRADAFADRRMNIPEAGNGVPDLLDETRVQVEWLLRMQVPEGQPLAGMAHHKMHDQAWTELGTMPHEDQSPRFLRPPSTAATLNLAAVAAQASRVYRAIDPAFSQRCLQGAQRAWKAALAHPKRFASKKDTVGGGPYDDTDVSDEFYWAAVELFITTLAPEYEQFFTRSPHHARVATAQPSSAADAGHHGALTWQTVAAAGTISLALSQDPRLAPLRDRARGAIRTAADELLALRAKEGYRIPFAAGPDGYPWGSNSFLLNNAILLSLAHDFTGDRKYVAAVTSAMDYLLGRNPIDQSYVTGYGTRPLRNPHHRFFAKQVRKDRPEPPPGIVSGGPNSGVQDPYARGAGLAGKPPQTCFLDHIESWSTNEITINWNAPFAWVSAFLDERARAGSP